MLAIDGRHDACQHLQFFRKNSSASAYAAKLNMCIDTTYKFYDVITNAMPAYFRSGAPSVMAVLTSLIEKEKNYRQILTEFDPYQKAIVVGEQDNMWPEPF